MNQEKNDLLQDEKSNEIEPEEAKRANLLSRCIFLFLTQSFLTVVVGKEVLLDNPGVWYTYADSQWIVFARFMCGIVLHVTLSGELQQGLNNMKYAVNHDWKFENYKIAWFCGFMQAFNVIIVELVNFAALLTNFTIIEIIRNFLALVVISQFDEYFFGAIQNDPLADFIGGDDHYKEFLKIQRTTSYSAVRIKNRANQPINKLVLQPCEHDLWNERKAE